MSTLQDLTRTSAKIGILSFGGPAAQIALMHKIYVDEKKWLKEDDYLSGLSFCMLLPGPEAMQLATYVGWRRHGILGGLIAGGLFVLPGALVILALSLTYALWGTLPLAQALFLGVKAAVVVIVVEALIRVAKRGLRGRAAVALAALSFVALFVFALPFPVVILAAAIFGYLTASGGAPTSAPRLAHLPRTLAVWLPLWWAPVALAAATGATLLTEIGLYFSRLAVVTFGGAYAVLAWMTQTAVADKGWLTTAAMIDGLGLAETTPGPLILVTEFVGFQAGFGAGGLPLAFAAALMTLWVTFAPCFLWIFAGAPLVGWITAQPRLKSALAAITAAVVGVIASLSLWFALHVFFTRLGTGPFAIPLPDPSSFDWRAAIIAIVAGWLLIGRHWPLAAVLGLAALGGATLSLV